MAVSGAGSRPVRVAVFDEFNRSRRYGATGRLHGQDVTHVLDRASRSADGQDIERVNNVSWRFEAKSARGLIERYFTRFFDTTNDNLARVLKSPDGVRVINQSQVASPVRLVNHLIQEHVKKDTAFGRTIAKEVGAKGPPYDLEKVAQRLLDLAERISRDSPRVQAARERYERLGESLKKKGIVHVVIAGNENDDVRALRKLGVKVPLDSARNILATDNRLVVAALRGGPGSDVADFSTRSHGIDIAADGTRVRTGPGGRRGDGTSFAAPQVAGLVADILSINPSLTVDQVEHILKDSAADTRAPATAEGAGGVDRREALALARQSLYSSRA